MFFLLFAIPFGGNGQAIIGSAQQLSCNCYKLTDEANYQAGAVWNSAQINLTQSFDYTFDVNLGEVQSILGGDGMAFVLQPINTNQYNSGGGLGYLNISPSIAVQLDTYDNQSAHDDIPQDHVAIMANGSVDHGSINNLAGPEIALVSGNDLEDGEWHLMRVTWDATATTMTVYIDGSLRTSYNGDIVNDVFSGDPMVFWGFTGSTGDAVNQQEFCFSIIPGVANLVTDEVCAGDSLEFEDDSFSALGDVVEWEWDFNNGHTSVEENPGYVQFTDPGNYTIQQTVTDAEGCDATESIDITVNPNPTADFSATETCEGAEMSLSDESTVSSGSVTDWEWDFGNGQTDFGNNVSVTYPNAGLYEVTLNVATSSGCMDSITAPVTVFENPVAEGTFESTSLDAVFTTELDAGDDAFWIIQDTAFTTDGMLNYSFPDSGWYDVALVVINGNGCEDTAFYSIYIDALPEYEIPNVFTPNGDDINERFQPETFAITEAVLKVFNRWGRPVFSYEGAVPAVDSWGWDGTINGGARAASGTYYYLLDLKGVNGDNFSEKGTVTLVR